MIKEIREKLEKPFDAKHIKQRKGSFGKMLSYISGDMIIRRANNVFGTAWHFSILGSHNPKDYIVGDTIIIGGRLEIPNIVEIREDGSFVLDSVMPYIVREGFAGKNITKKRDSDAYMDLTSDYKACVTDLQKKLLTMVGVALELYGTDEEDDEHESKSEEARAVSTAKLTETQLSAIKVLMDKKRVEMSDFLKKYQVTSLNELTDVRASDAISELNKIIVPVKA